MFFFRVDMRSVPQVNYRMRGIVHAEQHACLKHYWVFKLVLARPSKGTLHYQAFKGTV